MSLRSRNKVTPNFNMSSMTDIVFLLLIFFMLTSTLVSPNALKLLLPSSKAKTLEKQTISISISPEIDFYLNEKMVNANSIEQELKLLIGNEVEPAIILHADKSVAIEHVVKVMDIAYRNKYKIVLATTPH
ncbi:biopolymer transporter ExbD [Flavobacteriales bacterium]|nr:biopolymer transporter ExbD [Flavobacteriales bacterium]